MSFITGLSPACNHYLEYFTACTNTWTDSSAGNHYLHHFIACNQHLDYFTAFKQSSTTSQHVTNSWTS